MSVPDSPETTETAAVAAPSDSSSSPAAASPVDPLPTASTEAGEASGHADSNAPAETPGSAAPATSPPSPADVSQALRQSFPALFGGAVKPLKLRIQVDIQARAPGRFGKQALSAFFRRHTGSTSYLIAITKAPHRFDLDGQPAGEITAEHRQVAQAELARRRESQQSRRDLEDQQRRNRAGLLHDFQTTTLTKANFCALKGVPVEELDGLLERAREEAAAVPQGTNGRGPHERGPGRGRDDRPRGPAGGGARGGRTPDGHAPARGRR